MCAVISAVQPPDPGRAEAVHAGANVSFCWRERVCLSHGAGIKRLGKYSHEEEERKNGLWRGEKDGGAELRGEERN